MEKYNITSVHQIDKDGGIDFDTTIYSCFKFGDRRAAKKLAAELFQTVKQLIEDGKMPLSDYYVVASSPYLYTPAASSLIKDGFVKLFNNLLVEHGYQPVDEMRIYRQLVYSQDYGNMSAEDRENLVKAEDFYVDSGMIDDCNLIVIDDIRVTGLHEKMIVNAIEGSSAKPTSVDFLYYARVTDEEIPPSIEGALNFSFIKGLNDLRTLTTNDYQLTMRALKMILGSPIEEVKSFLNGQQREFVEDVYFATVGNNCSNVPEYKQSFDLLKSLL